MLNYIASIVDRAIYNARIDININLTLSLSVSKAFVLWIREESCSREDLGNTEPSECYPPSCRAGYASFSVQVCYYHDRHGRSTFSVNFVQFMQIFEACVKVSRKEYSSHQT